MMDHAKSFACDGPEEGAAPRAGAPSRGRRASTPKRQDLTELRVLLDGRGPHGPLLRSLDAHRGLAEHGAEVILVDHGLGEVTLGEMRRRAPFARFVPASATAALLGSLGDGPPPRFLLVAFPGIALDRREARELMAALGGSAAGAAIAPALCGPDGAMIEGAHEGREPLVWMARRDELSAGASLRMREHRGARALVERPAELAILQQGVRGS